MACAAVPLISAEAKKIVMRDDLRVCGLVDSHGGCRGENHLPGVASANNIADISWLRTEFAIGLHIDAVRTVIEVEIVLHRPNPCKPAKASVMLAEGHLKTLGFLAVDAHQVLRVVCRKAG